MSYPIKLLITSIVASLGIYLWNQFLPTEYNNQHIYFILPFFIIFSLLSFQSLSKTLDSENKNAFNFLIDNGMMKTDICHFCGKYPIENKYTFTEADGLCKAFGARLANYDEVESAYNKGGEWCSYGWSEGQKCE